MDEIKIIRKTNKPNKSNHKLQTYARVCEENKKEKELEEKNDYPLKYCMVEG